MDEWDEFRSIVQRGAWDEAGVLVSDIVEGWRFARDVVLYLLDGEAEQRMATFERALSALADALDDEPIDAELVQANADEVVALVRSWLEP